MRVTLLSAVAILLPSMLGYLLWELIQGRASARRNHWESLSFAFPLGAGAVAALVLLLANLGIPLTRKALLMPLAAGILILMICVKRLTRRAGAEIPNEDRTSSGAAWMWWVFLAVIVIEVMLIAAPLLRIPQIVDWDGWAIWGIKAKSIFMDRGFDRYLSRAAEYDFSWPRRPALSSIFQAFLFIVSGKYSEGAGRCVHLAFYVSLLLIFYVTLRTRLEPRISIAWTAMLATIPNLICHASAGLANLPLGIFLFSAVVTLDRWRTERAGSYLAASSLFFGYALLTRDEAFGLCVICIAVALALALRRPSISRRLILLHMILLVSGSALIYSLWARLVSSRPIFDVKTAWLTPMIFQRMHAHLPVLGWVLQSIVAELATPSNQFAASPFEESIGISLFWPLVALALILSGLRTIRERFRKGSAPQDELLVKCGICTALGALAYGVGLWLFPYSTLDELAVWAKVLDRQVISIAPMAACHLALVFSRASRI